MAQQVLVQLVDDLTGAASDDVTTVQFGLDGARYEIDLTDQNAARLRETLADYVGAGRRTGGRMKRGIRPVAERREGNEAGQIREWAKENGFELSGRGRIPGHVIDSYREAQTGTKSRRRKKR